MTAAQRDGTPANPADTALRIWAPGPEKKPGCEYSRSIGDSFAQTIGVTAEPEIVQLAYHSKDEVFVLASDGVTQFLSDAQIMGIVAQHDDPAEAVEALIREASWAWRDANDASYIDDITATVIFLPAAQSSLLDENAVGIHIPMQKLTSLNEDGETK
jgi:serine/threonine protein phosphatase PrpC